MYKHMNHKMNILKKNRAPLLKYSQNTVQNKNKKIDDKFGTSDGIESQKIEKSEKIETYSKKSQKIIVPADTFSSFENKNLNSRQSNTPDRNRNNSIELVTEKNRTNNISFDTNSEIEEIIIEDNSRHSENSVNSENFVSTVIDSNNCDLRLKITENDSENLSSKNSEISEVSEPSEITEMPKMEKPELPKISEVSEKPEQAKNFEMVLIKNENHEILDSNIKISKNTDKMQSKEVGEVLSTVPAHQASHGTPSTSFVSNKIVSPVAQQPCASNRVFIIKNLAGKSVTIIPKTTPVVLNKDTNAANKPAVSDSVNNCFVNKKQVLLNVNKDGSKTVVVQNNLLTKSDKTVVLKLDSASQCKNLIQKLPNTGFMKIADLNKSQKYFNPLKTQIRPLKIETTIPQRIIYAEVPKQCNPQVIDLTDDKEDMQKDVINKMPNFSKILQVLTESPKKTSVSKTFLDDTKIPIYVDCQTQTNLTPVKEVAVQTEVYMPSPTPSIEDIPNITDLLGYVFNTPKYSTGLDEVKKNDLIDMSKNIVVKGKTVTPPKGEEDLKKQLFLDLKDCATFDFLGHKPIHNAVLENNLGFLKRQIFALRIRKITLDIENNSGQTALQLAVSNNCNLEIITTLLGNGASANILDNEGNNLIHLAVINSTHFVLEILIKYLSEPVKEINRKNDEGLTPLMIASIDSKPEMVDMLLRNRADPNLRDEKSGRTALFHAVELNCNYVINLLLKYKADPKVRNFFGLTALDAAKDLDIPDSKILEAEKEANLQNNQTSVIVNMNVSKSLEKQVQTAGNKRAPKQNGVEKAAKKSKLCFVPSLMKVEISEVKKSTGRRRKK